MLRRDLSLTLLPLPSSLSMAGWFSPVTVSGPGDNTVHKQDPVRPKLQCNYSDKIQGGVSLLWQFCISTLWVFLA